MKYRILNILGILWLLGGCSTISVPNDFFYEEVKTDTFKLASWQKINNPNAKFKIYIEGDGASFDAYGRPTNNPTPKSKLVRELAFGDMNPNVVYLARPCQFVKDEMCSQRHWTTARFALEVINAEYEAIKQIAKDNDVVLVGFSGGAQVAGLVSAAKKGLKIKKVITIGGNLNHKTWTDWHEIYELNESLNLADYKEEFLKIPQVHYVGTKDKVIPKELVYEFVNNDKKVIKEVEASHNEGWEKIYPLIWKE